MDNNDSQPAQGVAKPVMDSGDCRSQLKDEYRQRIRNKIVDTLKRFPTCSGPVELQELKKIATRYEEKIFSAAKSQSEYLRKISIKMLTMESKSQNTMAYSLPSKSAGNSQSPTYAAMDHSNLQPAQGAAEPVMAPGNWRVQLQLESRQRIMNKLMDSRKRHCPFYGQEGPQELKKIATRSEEKIYSAARSQSDYLRKISLEMLAMESKSQNTMGNSLPSKSAGSSQNPSYAAIYNNNSQPGQGVAEPMMDTGDWRVQLQPDSRQRIVIKIIDTLKRRLSDSGPEGLVEIKKISTRFEEKIHSTATSQSDYLRKISLKMLTIESKPRNTVAGFLSSYSASNNQDVENAVSAIH